MRLQRLFIFLVCLLVVTGCFAKVSPTPTVELPPGQVPQQTLAPTQPGAQPQPTILPTQGGIFAPATSAPASVGAIRIWMAPNVPVELQAAIDPLIASGRFQWAAPDQAQVSLVSLPQGATSPLIARWVYVPVVPFATVASQISMADIQSYWQGNVAALANVTDTNQPPYFVTTAPVLYFLTRLLGASAANLPIETVPPDGVSPTLWQRHNAWGVVPFNRLEPTLKVLMLDGINIMDANRPSETYPLIETFGFVGDAALVNETSAAVNATGKWMLTNRDVTKLTALVMTGVTALVRATAFQMEATGITTPLTGIAPFLADANLIHTSNEVAFAADCPNPDRNSTALTFCSKDSYFELLKAMKLNIVELTGNHVNDWGRAALSHTLDLYDANGMVYFGGGRNLEQAKKGLILTHNGNTIAFIGCNPVGPAGAWATEDQPGSAPCDDDFLKDEIPRLLAVTPNVIMSIQYQEYYEYTIPAVQKAFFKKYANMGVTVIMGTQAHHPQGFGFVDGAYIDYGLGNLYFDQMFSLGTRQLVANKLIFYDNRLLTTILWTGLIEDFSRPRPMTADESAEFLHILFSASGWQ